MIRKKFHLYGRVQGVGFRFHTAQIAASLGLTGWAENLTDGSVCVQLQGDASAVEQAKEALLVPRGFIDVQQLEEEEIPIIEESGFSIL